MGDLQFGVLKPRQKTSTPVSNTQPSSTCASISSTLPVESSTTDIPVETSEKEAIPASPVKPVHVETKTELNCLKEEELDTNGSTPFSAPAHDSDLSDDLEYSVLEPSSYVFVKNVQIKLHRLGADEIKKWTKSHSETCNTSKGYRLRVRQSRASKTGISLRSNKVVNYRPMLIVSKKNIEPNATGKKNRSGSGRPKPSGPSSMRIHANQLILKAKQFTTKPVTKKYPVTTDAGSIANQSPLPDTSPVETNPPATDAEHVETYVSSTDDYEPPEKPVATGNATPANIATDSATPKRRRGKVNIKSYVLKKKNKAPRTAYCKLCTFSCPGVRALNEHHRSDHGIQFCPICSKGFNTQTSLDKHSYVHGENKFVCDICGKAFPFSSRLEQHKITHRDVHLFCMKPTCGKFFKTIGDLNRHVKQHNAVVLYQCDFCTYENVDKRNTESHMRTHIEGNERYSCKLCGKRFRFSTQKLRHKRDGCNLEDLK